MTTAPKAPETNRLQQAIERLDEAMNHHAAYDGMAAAVVRPDDLHIVLSRIGALRSAVMTEEAAGIKQIRQWLSDLEKKTDFAESSDTWAQNAVARIATLLSLIDRLQAAAPGLARTPGAIEACSKCGITWDGNWQGHCIDSLPGKFRLNCPINSGRLSATGDK